MSEYIPLEIQVEIIKRLPVKSLLQFRSVSNSWKCLIDSSDFISGYRVRQTDPQRLLVWYKDPADLEDKYVSFVSDEAFAQQKFTPTVPVLSTRLEHLQIVGSSQGLLCVHGFYHDPNHPHHGKEMVVLWNPSIRKSVGIFVSRELSRGLKIVLGFGVCPISSDPIIVKITNASVNLESSHIVEVFTLSGGSWRNSSSNLPKKSFQVTWSQVVIGSFIYWVASDMNDVKNDIFRTRKHLIISFDLTTKEFGLIDLPDSVAYPDFRSSLSVSKVWDSLAVLEYTTFVDLGTQTAWQVCAVWTMDHAVPKSFTKLFTIDIPYALTQILGFTVRGEAIMETQNNFKRPAALVVYEPNSKRFNDIGIYGRGFSFFASSYKETLLLLGQPDCSVLF